MVRWREGDVKALWNACAKVREKGERGGVTSERGRGRLHDKLFIYITRMGGFLRGSRKGKVDGEVTKSTELKALVNVRRLREDMLESDLLTPTLLT